MTRRNLFVVEKSLAEKRILLLELSIWNKRYWGSEMKNIRHDYSSGLIFMMACPQPSGGCLGTDTIHVGTASETWIQLNVCPSHPWGTGSWPVFDFFCLLCVLALAGCCQHAIEETVQSSWPSFEKLHSAKVVKASECPYVPGLNHSSYFVSVHFPLHSSL